MHSRLKLLGRDAANTRDAVRSSGRAVSIVAVVLAFGLTLPTARAADALASDGPTYAVNQVYIHFAEDLPVHPPTKLMMELDVTLGVTATGYVSPRDGLEQVTVKLKEVPTLSQDVMHRSAIQHIGGMIVDHFRQWGYAGVVVIPHPEDIDATGKDQRFEGQTALRLQVRSMTGRGRPIKIAKVWETASGVDGKPYPVSQVLVNIPKDVAANADDLRRLMETPIILGETEAGYIAPREGAKNIQVRAVDIAKLPGEVIYESGLRQISETLTKSAREIGLGEVYVAPSAKDIDADGNDIRLVNQTAMRFAVMPGELPAAPVIEPIGTDVQVADAGEQPAPEDLPEALESDGSIYPVSELVVQYDKDHPNLPPMDRVMGTKVELAKLSGGYGSPRFSAPTVQVALADLPRLPMHQFYGSAILHINQTLVRAYNKNGLIGIHIAPSSLDITAMGEDIRPDGQTALRLDVYAGIISEVRTVAAGERVDQEDRINNPAHDYQRMQMPVAEGDVLRKKEIDKYVNWLNRHPGRRVDVSISPGQAPGEVTLDMLISEAKPWTIYAQVSNTGTDQTDEFRERFGVIHNQLTGNDDILTVDYLTSGFDEAHAIIAAYELPLTEDRKLRGRATGTWSEYTASDVGFARQTFTGDEWSAGGDLILNIGQEDQMFIDLVVGARWQSVGVNDTILMIEGNEDFFMPHIGLEIEKVKQDQVILASLDFEINVADIANTSEEELTKLGRLFPDENAMRLKWDMLFSQYLEPVFNPRGWADPTTPESSTLAHELAIRFQGQYAFDTRLNPQRERTVGGLYSVRGYDESIIAADTALIGNIEYRLHVPRLFSPDPNPPTFLGEPFRWGPQHVYGRPDWDLVLRGFFDIGATFNSDSQPFEDDEVLYSTGAGVEVVIKRNLSFRMDWGYALRDSTFFAGEEGDSRFHFVGTVLY